MPLISAHLLLQAYSITLAITAATLLISPLAFLSSGPLWILGESMHIRPATFNPPPHSSNPASTAPGGITLNQKPPSILSPQSSETLPTPTRELLALVSFTLFLAALTQSLLATPLRYNSSSLLELAKRSTTKSRPKEQREQDTSAFAEQLYNLHSSQTLFLTLSGLRVLLQGSLIAYIYLVYADRSGASLAATINNMLSPDLPLTAMGLLANRVVFTIAMVDMLFWGYLYTVIREEARDIAGILGQRRKLTEEIEMEQ